VPVSVVLELREVFPEKLVAGAAEFLVMVMEPAEAEAEEVVETQVTSG